MAKRKQKQLRPYEPRVPANLWDLPDGHHAALRTGFDKRGGRIYVAPTHKDPWDEIRSDRQALDDFVEAMNRHIHSELRKLRRREDARLDLLEEDFGIKRADVTYFYAGYFERVTPPAADAVDPPVADSGKPSTRD